MSIDKLEEQRDKMLEELEGIQEVCDTLEICAKDDGCKTCKTNAQVKELEQKIEEVEDKIEELIQATEATEEE